MPPRRRRWPFLQLELRKVWVSHEACLPTPRCVEALFNMQLFATEAQDYRAEGACGCVRARQATHLRWQVCMAYTAAIHRDRTDAVHMCGVMHNAVAAIRCSARHAALLPPCSGSRLLLGTPRSIDYAVAAICCSAHHAALLLNIQVQPRASRMHPIRLQLPFAERVIEPKHAREESVR